MLKGLFFYLKLSLLCLKLAFNLFFFALELSLTKLSSKKNFSILLLTLLLLSLGLNFFLLKQKSIEKNITSRIEQNLSNTEFLKTEVLILDKSEVLNLKNWYLTLSEKRGIKNQQIYLNLSELNKIENNLEKTQEYLNLAQGIFSLKK